MNFVKRFTLPILFFFTAVLCSQSYAQVTIGSSTEPAPGAILQLKQDGTFANGANATRGLSFPRVKLTAYNGDLGTTMGVTAGSYDAASHVGLTVYATEKYSIFPLRCPGMAVWTGVEWESLIPAPVYPDITMTDKDGNEYNAMYYAVDPCDPNSEGAYWTTTNLYVTQKNTGGVFAANPEAKTRPNDVRLNPALSAIVGGGAPNATAIAVGGLSDAINISYGESENTITTLNKTMTQRQFAKKFGLLYTFAQAQEACPTGWHLPTDKEWQNLDELLGGWHKTSKVMRTNSNWYKPAHTLALLWANPDPKVGISGFNALPAGQVFSDGEWASSFAASVIWRTASGKMRGLGHPAYFHDRLLDPTHSDENDADISGTNYYSVRCVKDK